MQAGAVFFFHLFDRNYFLAESRKLSEFLLDFLQTFMPLTVSDLVLGGMPASQSILHIQLSNLGNFRPQTPYFFPKNFKVIHANRITHFCAV